MNFIAYKNLLLAESFPKDKLPKASPNLPGKVSANRIVVFSENLISDKMITYRMCESGRFGGEHRFANDLKLTFSD